MTEYFLGQFKTESHEHNRPINCVETKNVLADYMRICRPIFVEQLGAAVGIIAESGDIVRKRVYPDIDDMLVIKVDRNAPLKDERETQRSWIPGFMKLLTISFCGSRDK